MPISSVVVALTEVIATYRAPLTDWKSKLSDELRLIRQRLDEGDLGWRDSRCSHVWFHGPVRRRLMKHPQPTCSTESSTSIDSIYVAFDAAGNS